MSTCILTNNFVVLEHFQYPPIYPLHHLYSSYTKSRDAMYFKDFSRSPSKSNPTNVAKENFLKIFFNVKIVNFLLSFHFVSAEWVYRSTVTSTEKQVKRAVASAFSTVEKQAAQLKRAVASAFSTVWNYRRLS